MLAYTIRRLILIIPTLILVTIIVFLSVRFIPGSVVDMMVSRMSSQGGVSKVTVDTLRRDMGLDVPLYLQYVRWLGVWPQAEGGLHGLVEGDLGKSLWKQQPVTGIIAERLPVTFELGLIANITAAVDLDPSGNLFGHPAGYLGRLCGTHPVHFVYFSAFFLARHNGHGLPFHLVGLVAFASICSAS